MQKEKLENRIEALEAEITLIKKSIGVRKEKKSSSAWKNLEKLGKKKWKAKKTSWEIISESRR